MVDLYIVNTNMDLTYLEDSTKKISDEIKRKHIGFIDKVKEKYPMFDVPYFALISNHFVIPHRNDLSIRTVGYFNRDDAISLNEIIINALSTKFIHEGKKITGLVENSLHEIYPIAIEKLEEAGYNIKRISI